MAGIRERKYKTKGKVKSYYEISWYKDGKQYKKGGFSSKIDAQIELSKFIATDKKNVKFQVLANDYLKCHCALHCKPSTKTLYESYLNCNLQGLINKKASEIKKRDIELLVLQLKQKGLVNKSINGIITFVQAILNYGVENEFIYSNPIIKFKKLPQVKLEVHFLTEIQITTFLDMVQQFAPKYYAFFSTAIYTGMRRGELLALEWSDIDFKKHRITINKQIYKGVKQSTKTNKERVIDIPENLIEILKEHKIQNTTFTRLVFHNNGKPIHPYTMESVYFHPLIKKCNEVLDEENQIQKIRFHDLRHTYATYLLSNGIPVKYVQEQLGHSTARMTLDTYASFMPSVKFGALDLLKNIKKEHNKNIENEN